MRYLRSILVSLFFSLVVANCCNAQQINEQTNVLILGTPHLNTIEGLEIEMLRSTLTRLSEFSFDAICIESMPSELLHDIESRDDNTFEGVLQSFGGNRLERGKSAREILEIGRVEAQEKVDSICQLPMADDSARLELMELFIASDDLASAALQISFLNDTSVVNGSVYPREWFVDLFKDLERKNEIYLLALKIAKAEGLNRLEHVDNLQDEPLLFKYYPGFIEDYMANEETFADVMSHPIFEKSSVKLQEAIKNKDFLSYYQFVNSQEYMRGDFEGQWQIWLESGFESGSDRARYSLWEMRNLQIASNITKVCAQNPGRNILVIIGASHKSFLEKYLALNKDINLLDF